MADTVLLKKPEHSVCLGLILQGLFWMKGLIFKQRIFNILGFLPKLMIFQKFLWLQFLRQRAVLLDSDI